MMLQNNMTLLAVLFISIGVILGALIANLFAGRERGKRAQQEPEQEADANRVEMFRVIRNRKDGSLHLEIGGEDYASEKALPETTKPALQRLLVELAAWLGLQPARSVQPIGDKPAQTASAAVKPASPAMTPGAISTSADAPTRSLSIVEQIDELLRKRLAESPLRGQGIHLSEDPREGVIVWVGMEKFAGIDAITDDSVRDFIKEVVAEWEERQSNLNR